MSQYTDWFIVAKSKAQALAASADPFADYEHLSLKGILELELMGLAKLLRTRYEPDLLDQASEEGPLVLEVPRAFVNALAKLAAPQQKTLARSWRKSCEHLSGWSEAQVRRSLAQMASFAQRAMPARKCVLQIAGA